MSPPWLDTCRCHYLSTLFSLPRTRNILDDFREAYYWLRQNTDEHARVMSWWDYGYQIAGMANRTTLVDNNTWNNSHIALVRPLTIAELHLFSFFQFHFGFMTESVFCVEVLSRVSFNRAAFSGS